MFGLKRTPADRAPVAWFDNLPTLPTMHTPEQLAAWREAVASLPRRVIVPELPEHPTDEDRERRDRAVKVATEQRLQAEAEHVRTDPRERAQRRDLARIRLASLDRAARDIAAKRIVVEAELAALEDAPAEADAPA